MKSVVNSKAKGKRSEFPEIEAFLGSTLQPVTPRSTFVTGLKSKLVTEAHTRKPGISYLQYALIVVVGVSSGLLLVVTGARAIAGIIGAFSLLRLVSDQTTHKKNSVAILPAPR